jgi:hypothetical protein
MEQNVENQAIADWNARCRKNFERLWRDALTLEEWGHKKWYEWFERTRANMPEGKKKERYERALRLRKRVYGSCERRIVGVQRRLLRKKETDKIALPCKQQVNPNHSIPLLEHLLAMPKRVACIQVPTDDFVG